MLTFFPKATQMNTLTTLPIDCVVISRPNSHTLQSTPLYIIPNPIQALVIHSGCHLGRFPFLPYAFHVVAFILRLYYGIDTLSRFLPSKFAKPQSNTNITINATDFDLITIGSDATSHEHNSMSNPLPQTNKLFQTEAFATIMSPRDNKPREVTNTVTSTPPPYNFYTIFLLTSPEVSLLLQAKIIRLIDGASAAVISDHQSILPQDIPDQDTYTLDFAQLTAAFGWRLMQTIRYACTDTVYRFKPYSGHDLFRISSTGSCEAPPNLKRPPCPIHVHNAPKLDHSSPRDLTEQSIPPQPAISSLTASNPVIICTCPTVNLSTQHQSTNLLQLPVQHPPHDHSTYTLLYPQDLSHSHASRQPMQRFTGFSSKFLSRTIKGRVESSGTRPHVFLDEIKSLSLMGHYENIISLSSRVSKESYKQLVVVKPTSIAPIEAYANTIDAEDVPANQLIPAQEPLCPPTSSRPTHVLLTSVFPATVDCDRVLGNPCKSVSTTAADLDDIFESSRSSRLPTPSPLATTPQHQSNFPSNAQSVRHIALVANTVKFQHYSNRVPVHKSAKDQ